MRDLVYSGAVLVGSALAEAGDAAIDEARVARAQRLVIDAEPVLHAGAKIFHHYVGAISEFEEYFLALPALQIEGHGALVAV